jgi:hypothetical protein
MSILPYINFQQLQYRGLALATAWRPPAFETLREVHLTFDHLGIKGHRKAPHHFLTAMAVFHEHGLYILKQSRHYDFTLRCQDFNFPVHRDILAARSQYFRSCFCNNSVVSIMSEDDRHC